MQSPFLIRTFGLVHKGCEANLDPEVRIKLRIKNCNF